MHFPT